MKRMNGQTVNFSGNTVIEAKKYDFKEYIDSKLEKRKRGNNGTLLNQTRLNLHLVSAFDIETTRIHLYNKDLISERKYKMFKLCSKILKNKEHKILKEKKSIYSKIVEYSEKFAHCSIHSVMYLWGWQVDEHKTVIGRTWEEFVDFVTKLKQILGNNKRIIVYVHNLSHEFQFLKGIYRFKSNEVFATDNRRILKCTMFEGAIEFRCSYALTNMSLDDFTKKMNVKHQKLSGTIDYNVQRFYFDTVDKKVIDYQVNDVLGLVEAIKEQLKLYNDNLYTIPLTSTGYVRRDCKTAMRQYKLFVQGIYPDFNVYKLLRQAFRGGDTHAHRCNADYILKDVKAFDISSSYPSVLTCLKFPITKFFKCQQHVTKEELAELIFVREKAVLFKASFKNIRLKEKMFGDPYLSKDKCNKISDFYNEKGDKIDNKIFDNGRIIQAGYIETTLTDIDFKILLEEYDFDDMYIIECYHARYGYLPETLTDLIIKYYNEKTSLKDVKGSENLYMKFKNLINAIFGMMVQDPVIESLLYNSEKSSFDIDNSMSSEELLEKNRKNAFIVYQWGVWCTAYARQRLHRFIHILDPLDFVYCDTDSVYFIEKNPGEYDEKIKEVNAELCDLAINRGIYAEDSNNKMHFAGVFEKDGEYKRFKTLGAKKYLVEKKDGSIKATIAGVTKKLAPCELSKFGDALEVFSDGFTFKEAGGSDCFYNDIIEPFEVIIKGHKQLVTSNMSIVESTYRLSLSPEYSELLESSKKMLTAIEHHAKIRMYI